MVPNGEFAFNLNIETDQEFCDTNNVMINSNPIADQTYEVGSGPVTVDYRSYFSVEPAVCGANLEIEVNSDARL